MLKDGHAFEQKDSLGREHDLDVDRKHRSDWLEFV